MLGIKYHSFPEFKEVTFEDRGLDANTKEILRGKKKSHMARKHPWSKQNVSQSRFSLISALERSAISFETSKSDHIYYISRSL